MPIGFCCGGFSSTDGYVPVNEALSYAEANQSDCADFPAVPFRKASFVFIQTTLEKSEDLSLSKPFGFDSRRK